jgi:thiol-disulfide isomerase/thioredoxin
MMRSANMPVRRRAHRAARLTSHCRTVTCLGLTCAALLACSRDERLDKPAPSGRRDAVPFAGTNLPAPATAQASAKPLPHATSLAAEAPNKPPICLELEPPGKAVERKRISRKHAPSAPPLPEALPVGSGTWTWINLWAAWCVPCKEELPRLLSWRDRLRGRARIEFVSLDDDVRQLENYLGSQASAGLVNTYWLQEGEQRIQWLAALGLDREPELPAHILVDPNGQRRCFVPGALDDTDFARVEQLLVAGGRP